MLYAVQCEGSEFKLSIALYVVSDIRVERVSEGERSKDVTLPESITARESIAPGDYLRTTGRDVSNGTSALGAGMALGPVENGMLAALAFLSLGCLQSLSGR